jgi:outer membrane protein
MNLIKPLSASLAIVAGAGMANVYAYDAGDIILRAGATYVAPQDSSSKVALNGSTLSLSGGDSELAVDDNTQLGLTFNYMLTKSWGLEVLAATPFQHTASGKGELAGLNIADVKHLPPTVSAVYYFDSEKAFKPYVGAGINYTIFFDEELTSEADTTLSGLGLTNGSVELTDSWGLALQAGFDYEINPQWMINASVRWIDIDTEATITFDGGNKITSDVEIDPWVYTISVGYRF